jgi:hypothetical protein
MFKATVSAGVFGLAALTLAFTALASPDVGATGTAWLSSDPGYEGAWKYCYQVDWAGLPHGVSHVDVFLLLDECDCACAPGYFAFPDTIGSGPGTPNGEPCTVYYQGFLLCHGDPSIGIHTPLIKAEPYEDDCEPDKEGWAYICFYSVAAPVFGDYTDVIAIKFGTEWATGDLTGPLPSCDTDYSSLRASVWGEIKSLYR